jgi:nucleoside-triphosphatase THEP1
MIRILTGPIRSYKTTTLMQWTSRRNDVGGVLTPDVDGIRHLYNVRERIFIPWQKELAADDRDLVIGRFVFDHAAFQAAMGWLDDAIADAGIHSVILDEVGPLELKGGGWDRWLQSLQLPTGKEMILVVRENMVPEVIARYRLGTPEVVTREFFAL